ncbi:MAG TPA: hypothetical protein VNW71_06230 [Thermoanaerobaculia bacterium]|nr:hypothetical protein [Thermoanaerobaculia bacterium]
MSLLGVLFLLSPLPAAPAAPTAPIEIELKQGSPEEVRTRDQLLRLLREHDLGRWIFTRKVVIDGTPRLIPHSHPVLTLSTQSLKDDELLLSTFVHEQLHWYLEENHERAKPALEELRKLYPDAPSGPPGGARDLESTYRHLIVCYWEIRAAKELLGELRGFQVGQFWAQDHYMWIYRKVMEEGYKIGPVIHKHGLVPDARAASRPGTVPG